MVKIRKDNWNLLLVYSPHNWIDYFNEHFSEYGNKETIWIKRNIFEFKKDDLLYQNYDKNADEIIFILWKLEENFYKIKREILGTNNDILIYKDCEIKEKYFILNNFSILYRFEQLSNQQIIIGWDKNNSIPEEAFNKIINSFPTNTELTHYKNSRITNVLSEYLEWVIDSQNKYEKYLNKRKKIDININSIDWINKYEVEKYSFILETLKLMLNNYKDFTEKQWEQKILEIILILFPKYIKSYNSIPLIDYSTMKSKEIDIWLLDSNSNLDIIEIKKPSYDDLITKNSKSNRNNFIPMRNLSSAVMQVEKYIFYLNKWWIKLEEKLNKKYWIDIKITNPKWLLILWRCDLFSKEQKLDFEIIKRQYTNIIDIITYDDLIRRLENLIKKFSK